jgi:hypothetical protein
MGRGALFALSFGVSACHVGSSAVLLVSQLVVSSAASPSSLASSSVSSSVSSSACSSGFGKESGRTLQMQVVPPASPAPAASFSPIKRFAVYAVYGPLFNINS